MKNGKLFLFSMVLGLGVVAASTVITTTSKDYAIGINDAKRAVEHTVTLSITGPGQVSGDLLEGANMIEDGTQIQVVADTPWTDPQDVLHPEIRFEHWVVDGVPGSTNRIETFIVTTDMVIEAVFIQDNPYALLKIEGEGTVTGDLVPDVDVETSTGETFTLTAEASDVGYEFKHWKHVSVFLDGAIYSTNTTETFGVTDLNLIITAVFVEKIITAGSGARTTLSNGEIVITTGDSSINVSTGEVTSLDPYAIVPADKVGDLPAIEGQVQELPETTKVYFPGDIVVELDGEASLDVSTRKLTIPAESFIFIGTEAYYFLREGTFYPGGTFDSTDYILKTNKAGHESFIFNADKSIELVVGTAIINTNTKVSQFPEGGKLLPTGVVELEPNSTVIYDGGEPIVFAYGGSFDPRNPGASVITPEPYVPEPEVIPPPEPSQIPMIVAIGVIVLVTFVTLFACIHVLRHAKKNKGGNE